MTASQFRRLALELPGAVESSHMDHPDFRVGGKIFATLGPKEAWGMVKLTPDQQEAFLTAGPNVFSPASGAWGRGGATIVKLESARTPIVRHALTAAWRNLAPKRLQDGLDAS
ncbi:MAG: MmcQ/YjbR family DNA-binding protein [Candidatus Eiseniibacteriota bacterium]